MDEMLEIGELPRQMGSLGQEPPEPEEGAHHGFLDLSRPLWVRGEPVDRLEYDFDALTAADLHKASKYLKGLGIPVSVAALDGDYQIVLFARAVRKCMGTVELADIMRLPAADAGKAQTLAQNFLLGTNPGARELGAAMDLDG